LRRAGLLARMSSRRRCTVSEELDPMAVDRARQRRGRRLEADAAPQEVRAAHGWSQFMDMVPGGQYAERYPEMLRMGEEALELRVVCRVCRVPTWIALVPDEEMYPGFVAPRDRISRIAVWIAQRWCCEKCSTVEEMDQANADNRKALSERVRVSSIPRALASEVSWKSMLEEGATGEETKKRIRAIDAARRWSEQKAPKHGLLLWGPPGSGKTRLAATAAVARLAHSPITWISVRVLMAQLDAAWNDDDRQSALKAMLGKGAVVLDDIDKLENSRHRGNLYAAIDVRDQAGQRALIMTSNSRPSELEAKLGDVVMSRIAGICHSNAGLLEFPGPDRRLELGR
jgi:DNA replication protein DnaC